MHISLFCVIKLEFARFPYHQEAQSYLKKGSEEALQHKLVVPKRVLIIYEIQICQGVDILLEIKDLVWIEPIIFVI